MDNENEIKEFVNELYRAQGIIADVYGVRTQNVSIGEAAMIARRIDSARRAVRNLVTSLDRIAYKA